MSLCGLQVGALVWAISVCNLPAANLKASMSENAWQAWLLTVMID